MMRWHLLILFTSLFISSCASQPMPEKNKSARIDKNGFIDSYISYEKKILDEGRAESINMVRDEAVHIGTQAGYYWAATEINHALESVSYLLDQIDFKPLLFQENRYFIVPPVVTKDEGRRIISDSGRFIRLIDATFYIESDPRFVLEPPTWRDYLFLNLRIPDTPSEAMLPTNREEKEVWERGIKAGFQFGIRQAELTFKNKNAHLAQIYQGMILYHVLLTKKMVSAPQVKESYASVAGGGKRLVLEDSTVSIQVFPALNPNRYEWEVVPHLPDVSHLFPDLLHTNVRGQAK